MINTRHIFKHQNRSFFIFESRCKSAKSDAIKSDESKKTKEISPKSRLSHRTKMGEFFKKSPHLAKVKATIPEKYLSLQRVTPPANLYLIDRDVAKAAVQYILPDIKNNKEQIICETNAGLGLITSELLDNALKLVRLYESCADFKQYLKSKFESYKGRVEFFNKDLFLLFRYDYMDKQDNGNRVEQLLKGVPRKSWDDDPVMTIIGPLPSMDFMRFLIRSLMMQTSITSFGRLQFYIFMKPRDFIILTAGPHLNLHTYTALSVIFNLFFDCELLDKFPREVFLPWQTGKSLRMGRYAGKVDPDRMYFVKINFKKQLPIRGENLLAFYTFVVQFFGRGRKKIIPTLEKWVPGCGLNLMIPKVNHEDYSKDINIFTQFGELTPGQILSVFEETISHPEFAQDVFMRIIESHLIKTETAESSLNDTLEKNVDASSDNDQKV